MKNTVTYLQRQKELRISVAQKFADLVQLKMEGNQKTFNELLLKTLPEVKKYINRRLDAAIHKGHFSKGKYKAEDFIDQLFIEVYDSIEEVNNENEFYIWLFKKTNELLENAIIEEEFDSFFFKNINDYSKPEWDEMVEKFSIEADGNFVMKEDLDDPSYQNTKYTLNHVFIEDNEKDLIEKLDKKLSKDEVYKHIEMVLLNLPQPIQNVFDLFTKSFTLEEIAEIRKCTIEEVEQLLKVARKSIETTFLNKYQKLNNT